MTDTPVPDRTPHNVVDNRMPNPLLEAMSSLLRCGARVVDSYQDGQGHHLIVRKGAVVAHVTLALDYWTDGGTAWADCDMSWTVTRDGAPVTAARWMDVRAVVAAVTGD